MTSAGVVHIVDDDEAIRLGVSALLSTMAIEVHAYATATDFLAQASPGMSGCLVLDVRMPGMSGLELQQQLISRGIKLPIIIISGHGDVPMAVRAMKSGASDFLLKPFNEQDLLDRVMAALSSSELEIRQLQSAKETAAKFSTLTRREREILALIMKCQHSKSIAYDLNISEKTVDVHRFNIMRKTGARNLSELVQMRLQAGDDF